MHEVWQIMKSMGIAMLMVIPFALLMLYLVGRTRRKSIIRYEREQSLCSLDVSGRILKQHHDDLLPSEFFVVTERYGKKFHFKERWDSPGDYTLLGEE